MKTGEQVKLTCSPVPFQDMFWYLSESAYLELCLEAFQETPDSRALLARAVTSMSFGVGRFLLHLLFHAVAQLALRLALSPGLAVGARAGRRVSLIPGWSHESLSLRLH
jgi:hypothetical protein